VASVFLPMVSTVLRFLPYRALVRAAVAERAGLHFGGANQLRRRIGRSSATLACKGGNQPVSPSALPLPGFKSRPEQSLAYTPARPVPALKQRWPTHAFRAPVSKGRVSLILLRKRNQSGCLRPFEGPCPQCHAEATAAAHAHVTGRRRTACRSQRLCSPCSCWTAATMGTIYA